MCARLNYKFFLYFFAPLWCVRSLISMFCACLAWCRCGEHLVCMYWDQETVETFTSDEDSGGMADQGLLLLVGFGGHFER